MSPSNLGKNILKWKEVVFEEMRALEKNKTWSATVKRV